MMSCGRDVYSVFAFVFTVVKIVIFKGAGISLPAQKHTRMSRMALVRETTFIIIPYPGLSMKRKK
jgi:hypothetical protein